jgi:hypothetical protein
MATFKAWIALVGIPGDQRQAADAAASFAARRLNGYLSKVLGKVKGTPFSSASVGLNPTSASLGPKDLLVYVGGKGGLTSGFANTMGIELSGGGGGIVGGRTAAFDQGVLSEVDWPFIANNGRIASERGMMLANQAFHEFAHNKCNGDPHLDPENEVHLNGGGGLFGKPVMPAMLKSGEPNPANLKFIAKYLGLSVRQFPYYLYSDDLGY